jgi:hypothetical protein
MKSVDIVRSVMPVAGTYGVLPDPALLIVIPSDCPQQPQTKT